jgi:hypothetical protein
MQLNQVFTIKEYSDAYKYAVENDFLIIEQPRGVDGIRYFQIVEHPQPTIEEQKNALRRMREFKCFAIVNRGAVWYDTLTDENKKELSDWYQKWLDVTTTMQPPEKPEWLK